MYYCGNCKYKWNPKDYPDDIDYSKGWNCPNCEARNVFWEEK